MGFLKVEGCSTVAGLAAALLIATAQWVKCLETGNTGFIVFHQAAVNLAVDAVPIRCRSARGCAFKGGWLWVDA